MLDQQPAHRDVISPTHHRQGRRPQRGDGDRAGVVRIALGGLAGAQHPHPRRQRRRHVQHRLPGGDELLGEQIAHPTGRLHRPRPRPDTVSPLQQLAHLTSPGAHLDPSQLVLASIQHRRRVRPLVRVHSDHHIHRWVLLSLLGPWQALLIRRTGTSLL